MKGKNDIKQINPDLVPSQTSSIPGVKGEPKLTEFVHVFSYTVEWTLSPEGEIMAEWFGRTLIRSCVKLAYEHAQAYIRSWFPRVTRF